MDETWVHHFTPETKQQSKQWKHFGSPPLKKVKTVLSAGKVMSSFFIFIYLFLFVCLDTYSIFYSRLSPNQWHILCFTS